MAQAALRDDARTPEERARMLEAAAALTRQAARSAEETGKVERNIRTADDGVTSETQEPTEDEGIGRVTQAPGGDDAFGRERPTKVPRVSLEEPYMFVRVRSPDGNDVFFKARSSSVMKKSMNVYCNRLGLNMGLVRFLFNGDLLDASMTFGDAGLEDGDVIYAMIQQSGC
eukprot:GHVU01161573.1.p1 GENE.GHVU01161573.1~~GHVU01161573.1.p1  ORF type:complete len:196 (-),score=29.55 GHVU01161573.1:315-827(-)